MMKCHGEKINVIVLLTQNGFKITMHNAEWDIKNETLECR